MQNVRQQPDAECIACSKMFYSGEGHKLFPICKECNEGVDTDDDNEYNHYTTPQARVYFANERQ